jgi:hypothetical protein
MFDFFFRKPSKASPITISDSESDSSYLGSDVEATSIDGQSRSVDECFVDMPESEDEDEDEDTIISDAERESVTNLEDEPMSPPPIVVKVRKAAPVRKTPPPPPAPRKARALTRETPVPLPPVAPQKTRAAATSRPSSKVPQTLRGVVKKCTRGFAPPGPLRRVRRTQLLLLLEAAGPDMNVPIATKAYKRMMYGNAHVN